MCSAGVCLDEVYSENNEVNEEVESERLERESTKRQLIDHSKTTEGLLRDSQT